MHRDCLGDPRKINVFRRLLLSTALLAPLGLAALAPLPAAGQALPWPEQRLEAQLLPVVSDGRVEALLLLGDDPSLNPLDRLLAPRPRLGAAARVRTDRGNTIEAALMLDRAPGLALLCNESVGLVTTLAALNEHCLLARLSATQQDALLGNARATRLEAGWRSEQLGVDLSFGLGWLDSGRVQPWTGQDGAEGGILPGLFAPAPLIGAGLVPGLPELTGARLISRGIGVRGLFDLGSQRWLSVGGSHSQNRVEQGLLAGEALRRWDSSALSVGLGQGNLYGELTGHLADIPGSDAFWGGLDVGISWRMPWQAELTFGARNLLSRGTNPWLVDQAGEPLDEAESRVPYVRYHQDL
jgi:hypothetical protein